MTWMQLATHPRQKYVDAEILQTMLEDFETAYQEGFRAGVRASSDLVEDWALGQLRASKEKEEDAPCSSGEHEYQAMHLRHARLVITGLLSSEFTETPLGPNLFLDDVRRLVEHGLMDAALDLIFRWTDTCLKGGWVNRVKELLYIIDVWEWDEDILAALASATYPIRGSAVREHFVQRAGERLGYLIGEF